MFQFKLQNININHYGRLFLLISIIITGSFPLFAQQDSLVITDSVIKRDTVIIADTLAVKPDSALKDTTPKKPILESEVKYSSEDSLIFSVGDQKVFLFNDGVVNYQDIGLKGDYIEFDYNTRVALAAGAIDSSGRIGGKPEFTKGEDKYEFDTMRYNFDTHKAIIKSIITKQGEGYMHSNLTKRLENGEIDIKNGKYTTCDAPHPHFYIALTKAISIPDKRIVSGPGYLVFEDIPMPLGLPFGFFPNTNKRSSGFLIPEFRDEQRRGFGLENGGWYFAINDYIDISLVGSIYSRGTWGTKTVSQYLKRYKYNGQFSAQYFVNRINDDPTSTVSKDFKITWNHSQDPKANPTRTFRASVDFATSSFEKKQGTNFNNILENQKNSSISFTKRWPGRPFNFSANLNGTQSTRTKKVDLTLPSINFTVDRIYPFRGKNSSSGNYNWLQNITLSYNSQLVNKISQIPDSVLFSNQAFNPRYMHNGFSHTIPISVSNFKILKKLITVTPTVSYSGAVFPYYIRKSALSDTSIFRQNAITVDTIHKVTYAHSVSTSLSVGISPKIYGMFVSTKENSKVIAVRHVLSPKASASFTPDMKGVVPDYYREVASGSSAQRPVKYSEYSIYEGQVFGTPTVSGKSASVNLGLGNNLEMKVRSKKDSTGEGKKVVILDNLDFTTSYRPFATTNRWSTVNMSGRSTLFKNNLQLQVSSTFDPYALDTLGIRTDKFLIKEKGKLFRITNAQVNMSFRLQSPAGKKKEGSPSPDQDQGLNAPNEDEYGLNDIYEDAGGAVRSGYVDYDIPWSVNVNYTWSYSKSGFKSNINNTVRLSGDISLTPKWKIGVNSSYDFVAKEFTATNLSLHRDLHCWEMRFSVVPYGTYKSYSFTINAKSSILRDLKWDKRKTWYDNF